MRTDYDLRAIFAKKTELSENAVIMNMLTNPLEYNFTESKISASLLRPTNRIWCRVRATFNFLKPR